MGSTAMTPAASHLRVGTHVGLRRRVMQVADNDRHGSFWQQEVVLEVCSEAPDPSRGEQGCKMTNLQLETQHMRKIGPGCPVTHEHIPWTPRLHDTHTLPAPSLPGWIAMAASQAASFHLGQQSMHRPKSLLTSSDLTPGAPSSPRESQCLSEPLGLVNFQPHFPQPFAKNSVASI
jgi:hypothetical protein